MPGSFGQYRPDQCRIEQAEYWGALNGCPELDKAKPASREGIHTGCILFLGQVAERRLLSMLRLTASRALAPAFAAAPRPVILKPKNGIPHPHTIAWVKNAEVLYK